MNQVEFKKKYDVYDKEHAKILSDIDNAKKAIRKEMTSSRLYESIYSRT